MVFFFIAYLIIIIIFCLPFTVGICFVYDKNRKKTTFIINIGFFRKNLVKTNKNNKQKLNRSLKFSVKKISLKKPIFVNVNIDAKVPLFFNYFKNYFSSLANVFKTERYDNLHVRNNIVLSDSNDNLYFQLKASIKMNAFLIFSSLIQTLSIKRR